MKIMPIHVCVLILFFSMYGAVFAQPNGLSCAANNILVRLVVPFPPGSATDVLARSMEHVVVDNRSGASGINGTDIVAKAAPDGRTLLLGTVATHSINAAVFSKLPYDPLRDFSPVSTVASQVLLVVVHPSLNVNSVKELIAVAKNKPRAVNFATAGTGSIQHLSGALFSTSSGIELVHIPYKGTAPAVVDLLGGQAQLAFMPAATVLPQVKAGRLRAIATTGAKRTPLVPEIPTISESGIPGYEATSWYGLFAPPKTPRGLIECFNKSTQQFVNKPDLRERFGQQGLELMWNTPEQMREFVASETAKWSRVVKTANIKVE